MLFRSAELAGLSNVQKMHMMHECTIEAYTIGGDGTVSYGKGTDSVCGFSLNSGDMTGKEVYEDVQVSASVRLPLGTAVGMKDRITLTKAFGSTLDTPRVFEVVDFPDSFGPSGIVVKVREVYN